MEPGSVGAPPEPTRAPRAEAPAPVERRGLDLDSLAAEAELDRAELDRLMGAYAPKERGVAWRRGQRILGTVSRVSAATVFFDVGGKADAALDRAEAPDDVAVGDQLEVFVMSVQDGELRLTRTISGDSTREMLAEAKENGIPVQGKVVSRNDHGFEVQLSGGVRAFCPLSHIDFRLDPDLDSYLGRSLAFKVLDVRGREAIVTHRAIAEEEAKSERGRKLTELKEGEVYEGKVVSLRDFGAFVELPNGVEGLVALSNIGKARIQHPKDALQEGQVVTVRVLGVDLPRQRVNLGIRQATMELGVSEARLDTTKMSAGESGFGTFAGLLGAVKVSAPTAAAKSGAPAGKAAPEPLGARRKAR